MNAELNVFVTYDGEVKVIDFGLAKAENRVSKTAAGVIKGKVAYMSPEQAIGTPLDRRTDVFALGTTLWELACDRRLFKRNDDVETLRRVHAAEVPDPASIVAGFPPALWRILSRALARDRADRYPTAAAFGVDLDAFARGAGPESASASAVAEAMRSLFGGDVARQRAWVAEVSAPTERVSAPASAAPSPEGEGVEDGASTRAPLKTRSTFWGDDADVPSRAPPQGPAPQLPGFEAAAPMASGSPPPHSRARVARQIVVVMVAVVAVVFAVARALR